MAEVLLVFVFLAVGVGFSLLLWQAVQGEGRGETMDRRDAERAVRRDREDGTGDRDDPDAADDDPTGWGAEARRDRRD